MEELRKSASDEQEDILLEVMVVGGADAALMRSYEGRLGEFARPRLTSGYGHRVVRGNAPLCRLSRQSGC